MWAHVCSAGDLRLRIARREGSVGFERDTPRLRRHAGTDAGRQHHAAAPSRQQKTADRGRSDPLGQQLPQPRPEAVGGHDVAPQGRPLAHLRPRAPEHWLRAASRHNGEDLHATSPPA